MIHPNFGEYSINERGYMSRQREVDSIVRDELRSALGIENLRVFESQIYGSQSIYLECYPGYIGTNLNQLRLATVGQSLSDAAKNLMDAVERWKANTLLTKTKVS